MIDRLQIFSNTITVNNIENIISRAFDNAYIHQYLMLLKF